jgi:probable F420-dependent oxidoreductase
MDPRLKSSGGHPFRFGVMSTAATEPDAWKATARQIEDLGYDTLLLPDHVGKDESPALLALLAAATATSMIRLGTLVLNNDLHHPALLAREAAALDRLSGGRLELGLGAGWQRSEYEQLGMPFEPASIRIERLEESLRVLDAFFTADEITIKGSHYAIHALPALPRAIQRPRPTILVGGGGRQVLSVAARHADVVSVHLRIGPRGPDWSTATASAVGQKVGWLQAAAGLRFERLELSLMLFTFELTDERRSAADRVAARIGRPADEILDSPYHLIGSLDGVCADLQTRREQFGVSYFVVPGLWASAFAPVVARLSGR